MKIEPAGRSWTEQKKKEKMKDGEEEEQQSRQRVIPHSCRRRRRDLYLIVVDEGEEQLEVDRAEHGQQSTLGFRFGGEWSANTKRGAEASNHVFFLSFLFFFQSQH